MMINIMGIKDTVTIVRSQSLLVIDLTKVIPCHFRLVWCQIIDFL